MRLHDLPQRVLRQLLQLLTGPVAVVTFAEPVVRCDRDVPVADQCRRGLLTTVQRAADDCGERDLRQPLGQCLRLLTALLGEVHTWRPTRQQAPLVGLGQAMAHQQHGRHGALPWAEGPTLSTQFSSLSSRTCNQIARMKSDPLRGGRSMAEVEERIARLQQLLASPCEDRDDDTLSRTLRNLEQLRAEMALH